MFNRKKKQSLQINPDDPAFQAVYLGKIEIERARRPSSDSVYRAVESLWKRAEDVGAERMPRVSVALGPGGIFLEDLRPNTTHRYQFDIGNISYCMANRGFPCVFAWVVAEPKRKESTNNNHGGTKNVISESEDIKKPRCHVVVCEREDISRAMALLMTAYFNSAYRDHKLKERRETRKQVTRGKIDDLETRGTDGVLNDLNGPSTSTSKPGSRKQTGDVDHAKISKTISDPDAAALHAVEEKLRTLRVDPRKIKERGEVESLFNWMSDSDDGSVHEVKVDIHQ